MLSKTQKTQIYHIYFILVLLLLLQYLVVVIISFVIVESKESWNRLATILYFLKIYSFFFKESEKLIFWGKEKKEKSIKTYVTILLS